MLSYAFKVLNESSYKTIETEEFDNVYDLCATILVKGLSKQIKRGLEREYVLQKNTLSSLRGKINISDSIRTNTLLRNQLSCEYDEFTINSYKNQIIKTTLMVLLKSDIDKTRKKEIKKILLFYDDIDVINPHNINWNLHYNKNNQSYQMLISICYLVINGLILSENEGKEKHMMFFDDQRMCKLYERFILEYYKKEHPELVAAAPQIQWVLGDDDDDYLLPKMQTDITLKNKKSSKILVIDAKYYSHNTQKQYEKNTIHSSNLYQIFTYVKNLEAKNIDQNQTIAGMLLYAKTTDDIQPSAKYNMSGNQISVGALDLNTPFSDIKAYLDSLVVDFFFDN